MAKRFRSRRRFRRGKREYLWVTTLSTGGALTSTNATPFALVDGSDWSDAPALARGAVLERIVGHWAISADMAASEETAFTSTAVMLAFAKTNTEGLTELSLGAGFDMWNPVYFNTEDILYTDMLCIGGAQAAGYTAGAVHADVAHFDVRVKRKLTSDDVIYAGVDIQTVLTSTPVALYGVYRCLIALP